MLQSDQPGSVCYLGEFLKDAVSFGPVYFRGDSDVTWFGGWLTYWAIADWLRDAGLLHGSSVPCSAFLETLACYDGDLYEQLPPRERSRFDAAWAMMKSQYGLEVLPKYDPMPKRCEAHPVEAPAEYRAWFDTRETLAYQRSDGAGLRAVIFRDFTLDRTHHLLAQHFARSVFVWHNGQVYDEVIERERPDVVLHVMAERFVTRYDRFPPVASVTGEPVPG